VPAKAMSRAEVPEKLLSAKHEALTQLLSPTTAPPRLAAFAASSHPDHNVVGIGIGYKITNGKLTTQRCIRIYVDLKLAKTAMPKDFVLPPRFKGVLTDVVETGRFRPLPAVVPRERRRLRPARPGGSVGFQFTGNQAGFVMAGTFGAVVAADGARHILSNNHVLANENALPLGSPIFQPGLLDHGNPNTDRIGTLTRFVALTAGQANAVDCAIAAVLNPKTVRATFLAKVGRLKSPEPIAATEGMRVEKVGRTTGYTTGVVFDVSADVKIEYDLGMLTFQDQILVRGTTGMFSDRGDSGSVIVDRGTKRATALLFAGSASHTIANPLMDVLAQLGVSMVV
jgi:hypothetical protein